MCDLTALTLCFKLKVFYINVDNDDDDDDLTS